MAPGAPRNPRLKTFREPEEEVDDDGRQLIYSFPQTTFDHRADGYSVSTLLKVTPVSGEWYKEYRFDRTLPPTASSNECIEAAVNGMDSILIAYGGEGSGKSCLLLGKQGLNHMWNGTGEGIIPRAAAELLGAGLIVQCMCLAVSDSRVVDTFGSPDPTERRECYSALKGAIAKNIEKRRVATPEDALQLASAGLYAAKCLSKQEPHHTVFVLSSKSNADGSVVREARAHDTETEQRGSITLVELAPDSLAQSRTETNRGDNTMIAIKACLQAIGEGTRLQKAIHVPFRDSKLSHIIQGVLSGTGPAALVCMCSVENDDTKETMATLQFAQKTTPHRNKAKFIDSRSSTSAEAVSYPSPLSCGQGIAKRAYPHDASTGRLSPIPRKALEDNMVDTRSRQAGSPRSRSALSSGQREMWDIPVNTRSRSPPAHLVTSRLHESGGIGDSPQPYAVRLESSRLGKAIQAVRWTGHRDEREHRDSPKHHDAASSYHVWAGSPPPNGYASALLSPPSATPKPRRVPSHVGGAYDTCAAIKSRIVERQDAEDSTEWPGSKDKTTLNAWSLEVDSRKPPNSPPWDASVAHVEEDLPATELSPTPPPRAEPPRRHSTPQRRTATKRQVNKSPRRGGLRSSGDLRPQREEHEMVDTLLEETFAVRPESASRIAAPDAAERWMQEEEFLEDDAMETYLNGHSTHFRESALGSSPLRSSRSSRRLFEFGSRSEDGDFIKREHPRRKHTYDVRLLEIGKDLAAVRSRGSFAPHATLAHYRQLYGEDAGNRLYADTKVSKSLSLSPSPHSRSRTPPVSYRSDVTADSRATGGYSGSIAGVAARQYEEGESDDVDLFDALDRDGDGFLSHDEWESGFQNSRSRSPPIVPSHGSSKAMQVLTDMATAESQALVQDCVATLMAR